MYGAMPGLCFGWLSDDSQAQGSHIPYRKAHQPKTLMRFDDDLWLQAQFPEHHAKRHRHRTTQVLECLARDSTTLTII